MGVAIALGVGIWLGGAFLVASYAEKKGRGWGAFFALSLVTSPLFAWVCALVAADQGQAVASAPAPASASPGDRYDRLAKLGELRDSGVLTEAEFEAEKATLLHGGRSPQTS